MKIKVKKILKTQAVTFGDGKSADKMQFLTEDDKVMETFSKLEEGQEYEGDITENQYGVQFKKARTGGGGGWNGSKSDPNTMLVAYAKDMVVAFVDKGIIKTEKEAGKQILNFTQLFKTAFDRLTNGKPVTKVEEKPQEEEVPSFEELDEATKK